MISRYSRHNMRTILAAAIFACTAVSCTAASAAPVVKPAPVAHSAAVLPAAKAAPLPGTGTLARHETAMTAPAAMTKHAEQAAYGQSSKVETKISPLSPVTPAAPLTPATGLPSILPAQPAQPGVSAADPYAVRTDFGKSNLHKWSSVYGMDTPWDANDVTDTEHFKSSTVAFLDTLNTLAQSAGVSFVLTGGAEYGYHARGTYSHENGYKVDISDSGFYAGTTAYRILLEALTPFKHHLSHEWNNNHYDITIYPADYTGSYSGADHDNSGDDE